MSENTKKSFIFHWYFKLKWILIVILAFVLGGLLIPGIKGLRKKNVEHSLTEVMSIASDSANTLIAQKRVPYTVSVNFENIMLGEAGRHKKLEIMTQKVSVAHTATKNGLFNWGIFAQTKAMVFHGVGTYTVDLASIDETDFEVDDENQTITIHIPAPELSVEILPEETEFFDTSNGFLRFGEMNLTPETMTEIEVLGKEKLTEELRKDEQSAELARRFAELSVREIFQSIATAQVKATVDAANDEYAMPTYYVVKVEIDE